MKCEFDCLDLLNRLQEEMVAEFMPVIGEINLLLRRDWEVHLVHILRECNRAAYFIARSVGISLDVDNLNFERSSFELETFLLRDSVLFS